MPDNDKIIAIYSRKSKYTGKGKSIENQISMCRKYIEDHYGTDSFENVRVYEDEGFSGGSLNRPQFKSMMQEAKNKKLSMIIVYRLDRISRNIGDFTNLIEELNQLDVAFVSITENFETGSPMGRAMMYIASVFSQLERETIAERIKDNLHELSKTGRWLGGTTPTGYESESISTVTIDGKQKKACKLKVIPEEAKIVELIFEKFLDTESLSKTETFLLINGYTTKNQKPFSRFSIKNILSNPVYMIADKDAYQYLTQNNVSLFSDEENFNGENGIMAYNRTIQKTGKANKVREKNEWIVSVGKHPGLISGKSWVKVQTLLERNRSKSYPSSKSNIALLSGLIRCGNCGDYMRPKTARGTDKNGNPNFYYLCSTKEKSRMQLCNMKNPNGNLLDELVIEEIKKLSSDSHEFQKLLDQGKKSITEESKTSAERTESLQAEVEKNKKEIAGLITALANAAGSPAEKYIIKQMEELDQKNEELTAKIQELEKMDSKFSLYNIEFDLIKDMVRSLGSTLDQMPLAQKRSALRTLIKKIVWDGENAHVYLFSTDGEYELPQELPAASDMDVTLFEHDTPDSEDSK